jgi:hypothetical protein
MTIGLLSLAAGALGAPGGIAELSMPKPAAKRTMIPRKDEPPAPEPR